MATPSMGLVRFATVDGREVWIQPRDVAVVEDMGTHTVVAVRGGVDGGISVGLAGTAHEVVSRLCPWSADAQSNAPAAETQARALG